MRRRARAAVQAALLVAASVLLVLFLLEVALRLAGAAPEGEPAVRRMVDAGWTTLLDCYPSNPRGYFAIDLREPAHAARYRQLAPHRFDAIARHHRWAVESRYNALRFRERAPEPKPAGVARIVVFGDSFAEGQGVKEADTLARQLERLLAERVPGRYEVRAAARRGLDFPELSDAFEAALAYEPDLLVYALTLNDAVQPPEFRARQAFVNDWILDRRQPADGALPSAHASRAFAFVRARLSALRVGRATTAWYVDMWSDRNPGWRETGERLRTLQRRLAERGARLLVAPWPLFVALEQGYPFGAVHEAIRRFCLAEGIPHHELLEVYRGRRTAELWVHPVDHHPNEIAHRLAAESLAPVVTALAERPMLGSSAVLLRRRPH